MQASDVGNLYLEECIVSNSGIHGIYIQNSTGRIFKNNITGSAMFGINSLNSTMLIEGNSVIGSGNGGIFVHRLSQGSDDSIVTGNTVGQTSANLGGLGQYGNAISAYLADYVSVSNNKIYISTFSAVRFNQSNYGQILGNNCYSCGEVALWMEAPGPGTTFTGGIISDNVVNTAGGGITVANSAQMVIVSKNQIANIVVQTVIPGYQSAGQGIVAGISDVLIVGNQIENVATWGIVLVPFAIGSAIATAQAESNLLKNCTGGIGFVQGNTNTAFFIGGNTINNYTSNSTYAAVVDCSYNGVTGAVTRIPGSTDLGNATSSGFSNVQLLLNYAF
jgi:uncharacterized secreted repeat protein (TIGR03808 family)